MRKFLAVSCLMALLVAWRPACAAPALTVDIDTHLLAGTDAQLVFDLIDGGGPSNTASISNAFTDGVIGSHVLTGAATGQWPGMITLSDSTFFTEYLQHVTLGSSLRFNFLSSDLASSAGGVPDALSVFLLDASGQSLVTTSDPTGAQALFLYNVGENQPLDLYTSDRVNVTLQDAAPSTAVPEPASIALMLVGLIVLWAVRNRRWLVRIGSGVAAALALAASAQAADVTALVSITTSGLVLNRSTNTFDTKITVRNNASYPIAGPMRLILTSASPASVGVYNSYGRNAAGQDYVVVPTGASGVVPAGGSVLVPIKLINASGTAPSLQFSLDATPLPPSAVATLQVTATRLADDGVTKVPVGPGFVVRVDGQARGVTDANGQLSVVVPLKTKAVSIEQAPNLAGKSLLATTLSAGASLPVHVSVSDGAEIYADGVARLDQVRQLVLSRTESRLVLRFLSQEVAVAIASINFIQATGVSGSPVDLTSLFTVQADGTLAATGAPFYNALAGLAGKISIQVDAVATGGSTYDGIVNFYLADFKAQVNLVAPPSNPGLSLANIAVTANVLNTNIFVTGVSDALGRIVLPDLPAGSISVQATTSANGVNYTGAGTGILTQNSLVSVTMRSVDDILAGVPPIIITPLSTVGASAVAATAPAIHSAATTAERASYARTLASLQMPKAFTAVAAASVPTMVSVAVASASQNVVIEQSKQLVVPKGTKTVSLLYTVTSQEYPEYVTAQSIYNDVWSVSVLSQTGGTLFSQTRQVNSQLTQDPIWKAGGTTGLLKQTLDVGMLTANADANVILKATATNIGDSILTTWVSASLSNAGTLSIDSLAAEDIDTQNDGNYYSIPRPGATNSLQRTFELKITKPSGSTIDTVAVDLLNSVGASMMQTLQPTPPGQSGVQIASQTDTTAVLEVRVTASSPVSAVAGVPPPTRDIGYRFTVKGIDASGAALQDQKDSSVLRSLWRMPDGLPRYGSRDPGGDDWTSRGGYAWIAANHTLLREINDVSGEHGIDLRHITHDKGNDIDTYHFYLFPGITTAAGQGIKNHEALRADIVSAFGTVGVTSPPATATAALGRVGAWLTATRTGLTNLANNSSVTQVIHCLGTAGSGLSAGWCKALLKMGRVSMGTKVLTVAGPYTNAKMLNNDIHDDHVHVTLSPAAIGE